jgi:hypothetical protein
VLSITPILIGACYAFLMSLIREPHRRRLNAIMLAGAGAAYLSAGGFGPWEFVFTAVITYCAYRGLESWKFIAAGWVLHAGWDLLHYLSGKPPIIPFAHDSSLGCAICDPVIALWCLRGGPPASRLMARARALRSDKVSSAGLAQEIEAQLGN